MVGQQGLQLLLVLFEQEGGYGAFRQLLKSRIGRREYSEWPRLLQGFYQTGSFYGCDKGAMHFGRSRYINDVLFGHHLGFFLLHLCFTIVLRLQGRT